MKSDKKEHKTDNPSPNHNCFFQMMRQFKSHEAYGKRIPYISNTPKCNSKNESGFKSDKSQGSSPSAKMSLQKYVNSPSMFNQKDHYDSQKNNDDNDYKKDNSDNDVGNERSLDNTKNNDDDDSNVLEIDDSVIEQDNEFTIDTDLDEKKEPDYVLKEKSHLQLNNQLIHRTPKIAQNPFIQQNNIMTITTPINSKISKSQGVMKEELCKQLIVNAKKGDKETFMNIVEKCLVLDKNSVNYKDKETHWTSLHFACDEGNLKIVEILLKANCDINMQSKTNQTPLHLSCKRGYFDISKSLIENGALMSIVDDQKNTLIHQCALSGHIELMKYLLEKTSTAQVDLKNISNQTPLDMAKSQEMKDVLKKYLYKKEQKNHIPSVEIIITESNTSSAISDEDTPRITYCQIKKSPIEKAIGTQIRYDKNDNNKHNKNINKSNEFEGSSISPNQQQKRKGISSHRHDDTIPSFHISLKDDDNSDNSGMVKTNSKLSLQYKAKHIITTASPVNSKGKKPHTTKNTSAYGYKNCPKTSSQTTNQIDCRSLLNKSPKFSRQANRKYSVKNNTSTNTSINKIQNKSPDRDMNNLSIQSKYLNTTENTSRKLEKNIMSYTDIKQQQIDLTTTTEFNVMEEEKITPCSFTCLGILGKGSFGEVFLVEKIDTKNLYAMKVIPKSRIESQNLFRYAMAERNVLSLTNHPFIVKLSFAFQTKDRLFLVLDYCQGGDLTKHLYNEKRFSETRAKYYICEILLALEDLHKRDIIFRDLKPDNIVLDNEGHAKVTDFGLSKEGVFNSIGAKSFCGSIAYLAPEMLQRKGHGKAVDWYLLGVLFYEMIVGIPPFFTDQQEDIFRNIENGELQIPKFVSKEAGALLRELLRKNPLKRLGGGKDDAEEIKQHPYFANIDWNEVYHKKNPPPKMKPIKNPVQYFPVPKMFVNDNNETLFNDTSYHHFSGWSFINNDDNPETNS